MPCIYNPDTPEEADSKGGISRLANQAQRRKYPFESASLFVHFLNPFLGLTSNKNYRIGESFTVHPSSRGEVNVSFTLSPVLSFLI